MTNRVLEGFIFSATGQPMENVTVANGVHGLTTKTDKRGHWYLSVPKDSPYDIRLSKMTVDWAPPTTSKLQVWHVKAE